MMLSKIWTACVLTLLTLAFINVANARAVTEDDGGERDFAQDVARIKTILGLRFQIVGAGDIQADDDDATDETLSAHYVFADFNGDGVDDLVVAVEAVNATTLNDPKQNKRRLQVYLGKADGTMKLASENENIVLSPTDGGDLGDAFDGIQISVRGGFEISHSGLNGVTKWTTLQTFQFRNDDFYHVGQTDIREQTKMHTSEIIETNLITGDQIKTHVKADDSATDESSKVAVAPLVKLSATNLSIENLIK